MKNNIFEASELPESEQVYLKKDWLGWRVVEPIYNEDGTFNWKKLLIGTKRGWFQLIIYMIIVLLLYGGINELVGNYKRVADNPCDYCVSCQEQTRSFIQKYGNYYVKAGEKLEYLNNVSLDAPKISKGSGN